jgi:hypothetical protein
LAGEPVVRGFVLLDREELAVSEGEPVAGEALPLRSLDGNELGAARFELVKVAELTPGRFASPQPAAFRAQTRTRRKGAAMECPPQDFTRGPGTAVASTQELPELGESLLGDLLG